MLPAHHSDDLQIFLLSLMKPSFQASVIYFSFSGIGLYSVHNDQPLLLEPCIIKCFLWIRSYTCFYCTFCSSFESSLSKYSLIVTPYRRSFFSFSKEIKYIFCYIFMHKFIRHRLHALNSHNSFIEHNPQQFPVGILRIALVFGILRT